MTEYLIWGALLLIGYELDLLVKELHLMREDVIRLATGTRGVNANDRVGFRDAKELRRVSVVRLLPAMERRSRRRILRLHQRLGQHALVVATGLLSTQRI